MLGCERPLKPNESPTMSSSKVTSGPRGPQQKDEAESEDRHETEQVRQPSPSAQLDQLLSMLSSHRDEDKFVALLLLPRVVQPLDSEAVNRVVESMDWQFLARLIAAQPSPNGDIEETKSYWRVAATILKELAPFSASKEAEVGQLVNGLLGLLRRVCEVQPWSPSAEEPKKEQTEDEEIEDTSETDTDKKSKEPTTEPANGEPSSQELPLKTLVVSTISDLHQYLPSTQQALKPNICDLTRLAVEPFVSPANGAQILDLVSGVLLLSDPHSRDEGHHSPMSTLSAPPKNHKKEPTALDVLDIVLPTLVNELQGNKPLKLLASSSVLLTFLHKSTPNVCFLLRKIVSLLLLRSRARRATSAESVETFRLLSTATELLGPNFWTWNAEELGDKMPSGGQALAIAIGVVGAEIRVLLELVEIEAGTAGVSLEERQKNEASSSSSSSFSAPPAVPERQEMIPDEKADLPEKLLPVLLPLFVRLVDGLLSEDLSLPPDNLLPLRRTLSETFLAIAAFLTEQRLIARESKPEALSTELVHAAMDALGSYLREEEEAPEMRSAWIDVCLDLFRIGSFPDCTAGMLDEILEQPGGESWRESFEEQDGWSVLVEGLLIGPQKDQKAASAAWSLLHNEIVRNAQEDRTGPVAARGTHLILPKGVTPSMAARLVCCSTWRGNIRAACACCLLLSLLWEVYPEERNDSTASTGLEWIVKSMLKPDRDDWENLDEALYHISRTTLGYPHFATLLSTLPLSRSCTMPLLSVLFANHRRVGPWLPVAIAKRGSMKGRQLVVDAAGGTLNLGALVKSENGWESVLHAVAYEGHWWERTEEGFYD